MQGGCEVVGLLRGKVVRGKRGKVFGISYYTEIVDLR